MRVWAGLFGLILGGPVGWLAGAAIGPAPARSPRRSSTSACPTSGSTWFRAAVHPNTATVVLLVSEVNQAALIEEARRFTGAELVYANLDRATIERIKDALGDTTPVDVDDPPVHRAAPTLTVTRPSST